MHYDIRDSLRALKHFCSTNQRNRDEWFSEEIQRNSTSSSSSNLEKSSRGNTNPRFCHQKTGYSPIPTPPRTNKSKFSGVREGVSSTLPGQQSTRWIHPRTQRTRMWNYQSGSNQKAEREKKSTTGSRLFDKYDVILNFRSNLDMLENSFSSLSDFSKCDINKFCSVYFGVTNLSDTKLSWDALNALGKGLKFCPTPPIFDHGPLKENVDRFFRNISLYLFFQNTEQNTDQPKSTAYQHHELRLKSRFSPQMPNSLNYVYQSVIDHILENKSLT